MMADYQAPTCGAYQKSPIPCLNHKRHRNDEIVGLAAPPVRADGGLSCRRLYQSLVPRYLKARFAAEIRRRYDYKGEQFVGVGFCELSENGFMTFTDCTDTNNIDIFVFGGKTGAALRFICKGASARQCRTDIVKACRKARTGKSWIVNSQHL
jgi:hypothetical protein